MTSKYLGAADQAISTLTNLLIAVLAAHGATGPDYGRFALTILIYNVLVNMVRSYWFEPMLILSGDASRPQGCFGYVGREVACIGFLSGGVLACAGIVSGQPLFWILGAGLPGLLLQDFLRFSFFRTSAYKQALIIDLMWLVQLVAFAPLLLEEHAGVDLWMILWVGASNISLASRFLSLARLMGKDVSRDTRALTRRTGLAILADNIVADGVLQFATFAVPLVSTLSALGILRLSQVAAGPVNTILSAASLLALPVISAYYSEGRSADLRRISLQLCALGLAFGAAASLLFLLLPTNLGAIVFGHSWRSARIPAVIIAVASAVASVARVATIVLRATGQSARSTIARVATAPISFGCIVVGAWLDGALGAAWGFLVMAAVTATTYSILMFNSRSRASRPDPTFNYTMKEIG